MSLVRRTTEMDVPKRVRRMAVRGQVIERPPAAWLDTLPRDVQDAVVECLEVRVVPNQTLLMRQGDLPTDGRVAFWGVGSGRVRMDVAIEAQGSYPLHFMTSGRWFGVADSVRGTSRPASYTTMTECRIWSLSHSHLKELTDRHPIVWQGLAWIVMGNIESTLRRNQALMISDSKQRLLAILRNMAELNHTVRPLRPVVLDLTQDEIAVAANLTSRTVRGHLKQLQAEGLVKLDYKRITLL